MKFKRLRKTLGCLVLTGAMVLSVSQTAFATEKAAEIKEDTEPVTEEHTEQETQMQTESETNAQSESQTEQQTETQTQSEAPGESETKTTETESESESETETDQEIPVVEVDEMNEELQVIEKPQGEEEQEDHSDSNADLTTNIIAGNGIYLDALSGTYYLTFADGFSKVMDEIEEDFRQWLTRPEEFHAKNWQDVLAVYVLRTRQETGSREMILDGKAKEELEKIFFLMNIRSDSSITNKLSKEVELGAEICALTVKDYAELKNLDVDETEILEKYTSDECKKLCAIVTAAKGFVRGEVGADVSEERVAIVSAACSLIGKVGYFWGGKSYAIGWDSLWGNPMTVTAGGSKSTGTQRNYGLDCSGFVCWSYYNGLGKTDGGIGNHTTTQWNASEMIESKDAKPGDLVFYNSPVAGDQNHVGLVIGKNEDGSLLVAHCSSSKNGVVAGEAWSSGFKYVRRVSSLK